MTHIQKQNMLQSHCYSQFIRRGYLMTFVDKKRQSLFQCSDLLGQNEAQSPAAFTQSKIQVFDWMVLIHVQMLL